jgi:hypothetical protein
MGPFVLGFARCPKGRLRLASSYDTRSLASEHPSTVCQGVSIQGAQRNHHALPRSILIFGHSKPFSGFQVCSQTIPGSGPTNSGWASPNH